MSEFVVMENVKKTYKMGEVMIHAVDGVDIEIHKGEFAVIVGPSGASKTTVLNMLGGMDRVTSGKVIVDGRDISLYNSRQLTKYRRDDIGFVFQFYCRRHSRGADHQSECAGSAYRFGNRADF